jgi:16S rRNA (guanine527-N7)-methyltransferase
LLKNDFKKIVDSLYNVDIDISEFEAYADMIEQYNAMFDLTGFDRKDYYRKLFFDSVYLYNNFDLNEKKVLDIGSGCGVPGIPLKFIFKKMNLTLLDSNSKKTDFMKQCIIKLQIKDTKVVNARVEEYARQNEETYDFVISRALASFAILCEVSCRLLKINGALIPLKSRKINEEIKQLGKKIDVYNLKIDNVISEEYEGYNYSIPVVYKTGKTTGIYPRAWSTIIKDYK